MELITSLTFSGNRFYLSNLRPIFKWHKNLTELHKCIISALR